MLNLAEIYWKWRSSRKWIRTELGYKVRQFGPDRFAAKAGFNSYHSPDGYNSSSMGFIEKYCIHDKKTIERYYGKFLE